LALLGGIRNHETTLKEPKPPIYPEPPILQDHGDQIASPKPSEPPELPEPPKMEPLSRFLVLTLAPMFFMGLYALMMAIFKCFLVPRPSKFLFLFVNDLHFKFFWNFIT
jgi:hypothetical protein